MLYGEVAPIAPYFDVLPATLQHLSCPLQADEDSGRRVGLGRTRLTLATSQYAPMSWVSEIALTGAL